MAHSHVFDNINNSDYLNRVGMTFIKNVTKNAANAKHAWSVQDKVFSLAIFKRGRKCYNFLKNFLPLPSRATLNRVLKDFILETGINDDFFLKLKQRFDKMAELDKNCILMFDEIALSPQAVFDESKDKVIGYVDLGKQLGRRNEIANHALVFMIHGLRKIYKQPVAYYFVKDTVKTSDLKILIKEVVTALRDIGCNVLATVCDQGPTNRAAINQLSNGNGEPYFYLNNQKIITLFDVPHLLKSTRNAFLNYDIETSPGVYAKSDHLITAFELERDRRFQNVRKICKC